MPSTTPAPWRTPIARLPGTLDGMICPSIWVVSAAASRRISAARWTLNPAQCAVAPVSAAMAAINLASRNSICSAASSSKRRRSAGSVSRHCGKALAAASTQRLPSARLAAAATEATSSWAGWRRVKVRRSSASCHWPSMYRLQVIVMGVVTSCSAVPPVYRSPLMASVSGAVIAHFFAGIVRSSQHPNRA
ncbi:hypothetical protein SB00610_01467 [Klebsiella quasipneumoniae subsp. similipneumoniae]|nr:hypothetical protein SB00610_01467 [Klebsiella quasipneumoniae subsp. similipneumoniae]